MELILFLPFAAAFIAYYFKIGFWPNSPVQHPEKLFKRKRFLFATLGCFVLFLFLMSVSIPRLYDWFNVRPSATTPLWSWK